MTKSPAADNGSFAPTAHFEKTRNTSSIPEFSKLSFVTKSLADRTC